MFELLYILLSLYETQSSHQQEEHETPSGKGHKHNKQSYISEQEERHLPVPNKTPKICVLETSTMNMGTFLMMTMMSHNLKRQAVSKRLYEPAEHQVYSHHFKNYLLMNQWLNPKV